MKVKKSTDKAGPGYPTKRQFLTYGIILSAAAVTLGTIIGGCRRLKGRIAEPMPLGGVMLVEPQVTTCVVQHGDTLYSIAQRALGDGNRWRELAAANPGVTPKSLKVGQTLTLPDVPAK